MIASSIAVVAVTLSSNPALLNHLQVDPGQLTSPSPGKLVRYTIPDGGSVAPDQPYAEVEVRWEIGRPMNVRAALGSVCQLCARCQPCCM